MYYYKRLRDLREDNDYTQTYIGKVLGIDQRVYSTYETGKRAIPVNYIIILVDLYKTSVDYLLGLTDESKPYPRN